LKSALTKISFATSLINPSGPNGLLYGNTSQLGIQAIGVGIAIALAFIGTTVIMKIIDATIGLS
jgi:ammonium transporter, Amt family